jgi:hypothetical protein
MPIAVPKALAALIRIRLRSPLAIHFTVG